jgi:hypothetical protein
MAKQGRVKVGWSRPEKILRLILLILIQTMHTIKLKKFQIHWCPINLLSLLTLWAAQAYGEGDK